MCDAVLHQDCLTSQFGRAPHSPNLAGIAELQLVGVENPKPSARAWFQAASVQTLLKWIAAWIQQPIAQ